MDYAGPMTERLRSLALQLLGPQKAEQLLSRLAALVPDSGLNPPSGREGTVPFSESDIVAMAEPGWPSGPDKDAGEYLYQFLDDELEGLASV